MPTSNPNHNAQTHHDMHHPRRYYHRSILIPLWTQQLLLQLLGAILFWYATVLLWSPGHGPGPLPTDGRTRALLAAFAVMYAALVVATMCEVLLWCISRLTPATYLASQIGKTVLSAGVWGVFVWYPKVIRDPVASRREVTVAMSAVFAWLQVPMLSSLIHAILVMREERLIRRAARDERRRLHRSGHSSVSASGLVSPGTGAPQMACLGGGPAAATRDDSAPLLRGGRVLGYDSLGRAGGAV